ncbi:hypothetical protein V2J09_000220 [Rumex salicifolius]
MAPGKVMRSVEYSGYGGGVAGLKHVEGGIPVPKAKEVLLKVEAISLNALDRNTQLGKFRPFLPPKFPFTPGTDVSGEVVEIGTRVTNLKVGDKVVAWLHMGGGGLAEYAVARERMVAIRPPEVSAAEAAGLPIAAITAHQALTKDCGLKLDGTDERKNILVTAASGGVGHYAVQLAKLANAHVTATCGARNIELVKSLGADEVLDYRTAEGAALTSPSGKKYDYVIHCATGTSWSTFEANLAASCRVVDLTPGSAALWRHAINKLTLSKKHLVPFIFVKIEAEKLEVLVNLVKEKKLKTMISCRYPLTKVEDAWEDIISGHAVGKIIVEP